MMSTLTYNHDIHTSSSIDESNDNAITSTLLLSNNHNNDNDDDDNVNDDDDRKTTTANTANTTTTDDDGPFNNEMRPISPPMTINWSSPDYINNFIKPHTESLYTSTTAISSWSSYIHDSSDDNANDRTYNTSDENLDDDPPVYKRMKFEPMIFQKASSGETYTVQPIRRKRIYGDEFKELTILNAEPKAKLLKLEQPQHQILSSLDLDRQYNMPAPQYATIDEFNKHNRILNLAPKPSVVDNEYASNDYINAYFNNAPSCTEVEKTTTTPTELAPQLLLEQDKFQIPVEHQLQPQRHYNPIKVPTPTKTKRNFIINRIDFNNLPQLCLKCYSVTCICNYFSIKS